MVGTVWWQVGNTTGRTEYETESREQRTQWLSAPPLPHLHLTQPRTSGHCTMPPTFTVGLSTSLSRSRKSLTSMPRGLCPCWFYTPPSWPWRLDFTKVDITVNSYIHRMFPVSIIRVSRSFPILKSLCLHRVAEAHQDSEACTSLSNSLLSVSHLFLWRPSAQ